MKISLILDVVMSLQYIQDHIVLYIWLQKENTSPFTSSGRGLIIVWHFIYCLFYQ